MIEYIGFQVGFEKYFQDLHKFYGNLENNNGQLIFEKLVVRFLDFSNNIQDRVSIEDCVLCRYIDMDMDVYINNMQKNGFGVLEYSKNSDIPYATLRDPANMICKIYFSEKKQTPILNIPYSGKINDIDNFYNNIGINCTNGIIELNNSRIDYYSSKEEIQMLSDNFEMLFSADIYGNELVSIIENARGNIIIDDIAPLGRHVACLDPAKMVLLFWCNAEEGMHFMS